MTFEWYPPNPNTFIGRINELHAWNYSLFAKINSPSDLLFNTSMFNFTHNNNNIAALNVGIVNVSILPEEFIPGGTLAIGNYMFNEDTKIFNLEFKSLASNIGEKLWNEAEIIITMDDASWSKWSDGGYQSKHIEIFNKAEKQAIITNNDAVLRNMHFEAGEWSIIHIGFNFLTQEVMHDEFYYNVFQNDSETNSTIGSATFKIIRNPRELFKAEADYTWSTIENAYVLKAKDIKELAEYNWYDENGELAFSNSEITLPVGLSNKYKLEVISEHDRYKDYDVIEVKNLYGIISISPNPSSDHVKITCKIPQIEDGKSFIKITSLNGTNSKTYSINKDDTLIDVSSYTTGVYLVSLIYEDKIIDTKNLIIK